MSNNQQNITALPGFTAKVTFAAAIGEYHKATPFMNDLENGIRERPRRAYCSPDYCQGCSDAGKKCCIKYAFGQQICGCC